MTCGTYHEIFSRAFNACEEGPDRDPPEAALYHPMQRAEEGALHPPPLHLNKAAAGSRVVLLHLNAGVRWGRGRGHLTSGANWRLRGNKDSYDVLFRQQTLGCANNLVKL